MRRLLPSPADEVEATAEYAIPAGQSWVRANMVATIDGSVTDGAGLSGGISGEPDRRVFHVLRSLADAVVVGARTAQSERYRRAAVPVVLLTRTLDLDLTTPLLAAPPEPGRAPVLVIAPASAPADNRAALLAHAEAVPGLELLTAGDDTLDLAQAVDCLRARGFQNLLCEGGPSILAAMIGRGLVDELCVTTSPMVVSGTAGRIVRGPSLDGPAGWRLAGLCEDESFLFARWVHTL